MTDATVMTTATEPDGAPRVASLDILRGIAILSILFMNISDMGGSIWAFFGGDIRHIGWTQADQAAWWLREVLASGTARAMLEMLFGVGMVILTDRAVSTIAAAPPRGRLHRTARWLFGPWAVMKPYFWRNIVLFVFGLIHIFVLLWSGDILHTYGLAALVAFLFRRLGPKTLLAVGLSMALLQLVGAGIGLTLAQRSIASAPAFQARVDAGQTLSKADAKALADHKKQIESRAKAKAENKRNIAIEDRLRSPDTGTAQTWAKSVWATSLNLLGVGGVYGEGALLEPLFIWEAAGTMLIGAALFKWGIIQGRRSRRFYLTTLVIAYAIGFGCRIGTGWAITRFDDYPSLFYATGEVARLATTLGHIALVHLVLASVLGAKLLRPFEAAGRTALTIYIAQTLICLWLLYPPFALGLYGQQGWMALMITATVVNALLLWAANVYLRHYRIAPVEWAWRSIVAGKRLPFRKSGVASAGGSVPLAA